MLSTMSDLTEKHLILAQNLFPYDELPKCKEYPVRTFGHKKSEKVHPNNSVRMLDRIQAINYIKRSR